MLSVEETSDQSAAQTAQAIFIKCCEKIHVVMVLINRHAITFLLG